MDFLKDECVEWFGRDRPKTRVPAYVLEHLKLAASELPPHDVWLKRALGMPDYPISKRHVG
jgi:hypothetical protein